MSFIQVPPSDYLTTSPQWLRILRWNLRNPFRAISDKFAVSEIPGTPTFNPKGGFEYLRFSNGMPRFISYRGKLIELYIGWRPSGLFGISLRHSHAQNYK